MHEAKSGSVVAFFPGCRFAHPGYEGFRAAMRFQRWKNLISSPSVDNPIPADTPALASARTTARSGGTREASLMILIHSANSRGLSQLASDSMAKPAPPPKAANSEPGNNRPGGGSPRGFIRFFNSASAG